MSFNDNYLKLRKKRLEEERAAQQDNSFKFVSGPYQNATKTEYDIGPVQTSNNTETSKKKQEGSNSWFQKGAFEDGYQLGDISKTILGTIQDVGDNVNTAVVDATENLIDTTAYGVGAIGGMFSDDFQDDVGDFIAKDLLKSDTSGKALHKFSSPLALLTDLILQGDTEGNSVLGEKSDGLVQSGAHLAGSYALAQLGVPAELTMGVNAFGSEIETAYQNGATHLEAGISGAISAGAEILFERFSGGIKILKGTTVDDAAVKWLSKNVSNKVVRTLAKFGMDMAGEGAEEVATEAVSAVGRKLTYADEQEWEELFSSEDAWDAFVGGAVMSGVVGGGKIASSNIKGRDYTSGLTANEETVLNKVYNDRVAKAEQNGTKLTDAEKNEIYEQVENELKKGYLSTDDIESALGGDTYKTYRDTIDSEDAILKEFDELGKKQNATLADQARYAELQAQVKEIKNNSNRNNLKSQLSEEVYNSVKEKDSYLAESYNERARRGTAFEADLSKYDKKSAETVKRAIDSGILNNTRRTHEFVDMVAKISADKGVLFDFTNNQKLKESGFAIDGAAINGYVTKDGVAVNIDSHKSLNSVVGHEITHVLEGTELYAEMQSALFEYAKSKKDYDSRRKSLEALYKNVEGAEVDAELTADLVGDYLFTDEDFINNLSTKHRNVFQKIYDEIKYLLKIATKGSKEARELEKAKRAFDKAYREGGEASGEVKYSASNNKTIDKYTQKQYNDFGWARDIEAITKNELDDLYSKVQEKGSLKKFTQTSNGEAIIEVNDDPHATLKVNNVFVFAKGTKNNPEITRVVRVNFYDEASVDVFRKDIYERTDNRSLASLARFVGEESIQYYERSSRADYRAYKDRTRTQQSGSGSEGNTGDYRNGKQRVWRFEETQSNEKAPINKASSKDGVFFDGKKTKLSLSEDGDTFSRIYDMQVEVNQLRRSIEEFEKSDDFKSQMSKLSEAIANDDIENGVKAYEEWKKKSGYDELITKRDTLQAELEKLNKEYNDSITNKALEEEKAAIAKSGLSEADYFRKQAVKEFGYTPYFYDAGYITPNGKMLNFSGEKGYHYGGRGQDHRAIGTIYADTQGSDALNRFVKDGNIRIMAESPGVDISTTAEPTKEQYATIRKFIYEYADKGFFNVDLTDESGRVIGSLNYENRINPARILNDIKHYYATGEIRQQSNVDRFRFSLSNPQTDKDYLDAVERGDVETAQKIVEDVAKESGYSKKMFHETDAENIHIFDIARGDHGGTDNETPYGIFTKSSDKNIGLGSKQMALYVKADNTLYVANREAVKTKIPELIPYYDEISRIDKEYDALANKLEDAEFDALAEWMDENPDADMDVVFPTSYIIDNKPADIDSQKYLDAHFERNRVMQEWSAKYNEVAVKCKELITSFLRNNGYDSMYLQVDGGSRGRQTDSLILLDTNQVKSSEPITYDNNGNVIPLSERFNANDNDIRYSLSAEGKKRKRYGNYNVYGDDIRLEAPIQEEVAPVDKAVDKTVDVAVAKNAIPTENFAPLPSEPTLYDLEQEQAELEDTIRAAMESNDPNAPKLIDEYGELLDTIAKRKKEESAMESERLASLDDMEAPPEVEAPYYDENSSAINPFDERDIKAVGNRKVKAYMYENPEVKPFFQEEANVMLGELRNGLKGERIYTPVEGGVPGMYGSDSYGVWHGIKRNVSADIAYLLDELHFSYDDIRKGLNAIIEDNGKENNAVSKRIEFVLNDRLMKGYYDFATGIDIPPDQDYINLLKEKQITEYSEEARAKFFEEADKYAPFAEDISPIAEDIAPIAPVAESKQSAEVYEEIKPKKQSAEPRMKRVKEGESSPNKKERKWIGTSTESEAVDGKILPEDLDQEAIHYQPISNKKTLSQANVRLDKMGYEASLAYFNSQFANKKTTVEDIVLGERLIQEAIKRGDTQTAGALIEDVAILGTELGQKVQALSIIKRLTPEGQLRMLQRTVERGKTREDKAYEGVEITQEMIDKILKAYNEDGSFDQAKLNEAVEDAKQKIADQMKVTVMDKVNAWRYLSMLGNPKTHIRNLVSNIAMQGTVKVKNTLARTIETFAPIENKTKTWKAASSEVKAFSQKTAIEMQDILSDGGKYNEDASIKQKRAIFKNKILNGVYEFNSDLLSKEDWWFSKPAFTSALSEFLTANGIRTEQDIQNNPKIVAKAKQYATEQSQIATFRQYSWLSNKINEIEHKNIATQVAVGAVLPFKKTPINIAKTALNYSPLGFAKTLTYDAAQVKNGKMEASELVDHLAQNVTGSSLVLIGYMLAAAGILNGAGDDDKEGDYDYQLGEQAYSINIGDATFSLSWLSPIAMPLFVGANAYEQLVEGKEWNGNVVVETLAQTLDPLSEMSFLSSLDSVLSSYDSGLEKFAGIAQSASQSYITQFVPTLSSQIAAVMDDKKRSTKVAADSDFKFVDETVNKLKYKIPFLRETLEPSTDIWGNEIKQSENVMERAFETFFAPYSKKEDISTGVDEELKTLYKETGDAGLIPSIPYNYINYDGEKYEMSASEYTEYKELYGQSAYELMSDLFKTNTYKNASSEERADMVNRVYDFARDEAKREYFAKYGVEFTNATKDGEEYYKENSIKGAIKYDMTPDEYEFATENPEKYKFLHDVGLTYEEYDNGSEDFKDAYSWAFKNPEKFTVSKAVASDVVTYRKYASEMYDIKADKDEYGKSISGSRKEKIIDYVNNLDIDYGARLILFKSEYNADDTYNYEIIDYLNNREDISYEEMATILKELDFIVRSDGTILWD